MNHLLVANWWAVALRGFAALVFGALTLLMPGLTLALLIGLFAAFAMVDGIFALIAGLYRAREGSAWGGAVALGIVSVAVGVGALLWPALTAVALVYVVAAWAIVHGVMEIVSAIELRRYLQNEWLLALAGIGSIVLGVVMAANPALGALAIAVMVGSYAMVYGALVIAAGFRLRALDRGVAAPEEERVLPPEDRRIAS